MKALTLRISASKSAHSLSAEIAGSVCIVEVSAIRDAMRTVFKSQFHTSKDLIACGIPLFSLSKNLWLMPWDVFLRHRKALSAGWVRSRLDELRLAFDFTIFQAPPAGQFSDPLLLGHLCDGVVLVLTANSTRRVAATQSERKTRFRQMPAYWERS